MHVLSYILHIIFRGIIMNESIVPYVPIADRVHATNEKSQLLCQQLFKIVDQCVQAQFLFNHDTEKGFLSICPDQINDLLSELSKTNHIDSQFDIDILKQSLSDLIYPKFNGEHRVISHIWNNVEVRVWQFQLNQIACEVDMEHLDNDPELSLDMALSSLRIWRTSLQNGSVNYDVVYKKNDLIYKLMDLEEKLKIIQRSLDE